MLGYAYRSLFTTAHIDLVLVLVATMRFPPPGPPATIIRSIVFSPPAGVLGIENVQPLK